MEHHRGPRGWDRDPGNPARFGRRILLCVTGLTPQVVTETTYALAVLRDPPFVPTEVHLISTTEGAHRARLMLLSDEPGWFHRLRRDYGLGDIRFGPDTIHVLRGRGREPIDDIRTEEDNRDAADFILGMIREFTGDPSAALHVSMAGGRKTLGFFAGYALSLCGRPQDRLSHVLVSPPFESNPGFFYPTPGSSVLFTPPPDSRPLDARDAEITLAEIPFVRMRQGLDERLRSGNASYSETVRAAQQAIGIQELVLDLEQRKVRAGNAVFRLRPREMAFLSWIARRTVEGRPVDCPPEDTAGRGDASLAEELLAEGQRLRGGLREDTRRRLAEEGMSRSFFLEVKAKLHRSLEEHLGVEGARQLRIRQVGGRHAPYRIGLPPERIRWGPVEAEEGR